MRVAIIDYRAGNTQSVINAINRLGIHPILTSDRDQILSADKVIFPGVGHAKTAMLELERRGLIEIIKEIKAPFLGICVGMQLLFDYSEEGNVNCLSVMQGQIKKFHSSHMKIPKMGWNTISFEHQHPLFKDIGIDPYFYFVHSYYLPRCEYTIAKTDYIQIYSAAVQYKNYYGVQFHPEKSGIYGDQVLKNFLTIQP
jgi:glutamine amidotransferase